jgi:hypothetical protein
MPNPVDRPSLKTDLASRYASQRTGGAYDAKTAGTVFDDFMNNEFANGFTKGGRNTLLPKKESSFAKGLNNKKYSEVPKG